MLKTFLSEIKLKEVTNRTRNLISTLNDTSVAGSAVMVVMEASPISDSQEVEGKIQFAVNDDLKVTFGVIAPTIEYLSNFASRFNMGYAHYCEIKFYVEESSKVLRLEFTPPSESCEAIIQNFFEMTSSTSINWWKSKKKYFAGSISFHFYYYSADSSVSGAS